MAAYRPHTLAIVASLLLFICCAHGQENITDYHLRHLQTYTASDNFQALMLQAVNAERAKNGLSALCTNSKLQNAAQLHSQDMATNNFMSHTGSTGSTMSSRITAQGFNWNAIAENVAAGQVDVAAVMVAWMNSAGHKANILGDYKFFGTGYSYSSTSTYKHYWTQDFASGPTEACDANSTPTTAPTPITQAPVATPAPTTKAPTPAPTTKAPTVAPTSAPTSSSSSIQSQMLQAVNAERIKQGLAAFCTNSKLQNAAQLHSQDMATNNFMSHTGSTGSTMSSRITAQGFNWNAIAENVAAGQVDVTAVVKSWMNSAGHRANILGNYKFFGMGYAYNAKGTYKHYWTQDFASGTTEVCDSYAS